MNYVDQVKRADLRLREKYPTLQTQIFRMQNERYEIVVKDYFGTFSEISQNFNHSICPLHLPIYLRESVPDNFEELISSIEDTVIPSEFSGLQLNKYDVKNYVESRFHGVSVVGVLYDETEKALVLELTEITLEENEIKNSVVGLGIAKSVAIKYTSEKNTVIKPPDNAVFYIPSSHELAKLDLPFLRRDEELWFENIGKIYNGTMGKEDLFFFNPQDKACFVNYSLFNHINIRNQLLLYDVVYCSLPLLGNLQEFFRNQSLTRDEFLSLAQKGRVKVIITQPEFRHEYDIFREIYERNPNAIISRRALAALCAIDVVSINNNYLVNDSELTPFIRPLIAAISEISGADPNSIAKFLMWPSSAVKASFEMLHAASAKRISNYGVNEVILCSASEEFREKYEFEFVVNAEPIHIAHALGATYFPHLSDGSGYTDEPYALMMGNMLNFYRNFNKMNVVDVLATDKLKDSGVRLLDPINVIEANTYIPIQEFEDIAGAKYIRRGFRSLFDELSVLDLDERNERIREYNLELKEHLGYEGFKGGAFDLGTDATGIPCFGFGKRIGCFIYGKAKEKSRGFSAFAEKVEDIANMSLSGDPRITLLAKINRIARLIRI